jgi:serine protease Do
MKKLLPLIFIIWYASYGFGQDKDLKIVCKFQRKLQKLIKKVTPAFVFIGGGSGVCISKDGYIITNHHVAGMAKKWRVVINKKRYRAKLIGWDKSGDIALLKVENPPQELPYLELGDSDKIEVGQSVIAVGNPFMLGSQNWEPTVTYGIISAVYRFVGGGYAYAAAIQTDAQINPGNSGGPLITMDGKIVGINGMIHMRFFTRVNTGIGFAVPSNQIKRFLPFLRKGGRVYHGCIDGLIVADVDDPAYEVAEAGEGVLVAGVTTNTPAAEAGFEPGDIITQIEGYRIFNRNRFHTILWTYPEGTTVKVKYKRKMKDGKYKFFETKVYLGDMERRKKKDKKKDM